MSRYELDTLKTLFRTVYTRILKIWTDMYTYTASKYALPLNTAVAWNIFIFLPEYNTVVDGVFVVFAGSNGLINNTPFILYSVHCYCMCNLAAFVAFLQDPRVQPHLLEVFDSNILKSSSYTPRICPLQILISPSIYRCFFFCYLIFSLAHFFFSFPE